MSKFFQHWSPLPSPPPAFTFPLSHSRAYVPCSMYPTCLHSTTPYSVHSELSSLHPGVAFCRERLITHLCPNVATSGILILSKIQTRPLGNLSHYRQGGILWVRLAKSINILRLHKRNLRRNYSNCINGSIRQLQRNLPPAANATSRRLFSSASTATLVSPCILTGNDIYEGTSGFHATSLP
jgi:hypothetical protein